MTKLYRKGAKRGERGATIILFTFTMFLVVIPLIGLAIDGSIVMWEKARLTTAVDAAALAAGRSLSAGLTLQQQQNTATSIGQNYFQANFQPGQMGTAVTNSGGEPSISFSQDSTGLRRISVQANITVPLFFMRLLNFNTASLQAIGQASRKDVNVMLVLDRSGSMARSNSCGPMIAAAQSFVNMFVDGRDSLGLVTFTRTANIDSPASTTFRSNISNQLSQLVCAGGTNSAWGLGLAYDEIKRLNLQGASNVIVFFSDGWPSALRFSAVNGYQNALLPMRNQPADDGDTRYYSTSTSTESTFAHSPCTSAPLSGVLEAYTNDVGSTGSTLGVWQDTQFSISSSEGGALDQAHLVQAGCYFNNPTNNASTPYIYMRRDVAYVPEIDYYGNPTASTLNPLGPQPFRATLRFPNDGVHLYGNYPIPNVSNPSRLRPDTPETITDAAFNAADNMAYTIRKDIKYNPIIYSIGLGSAVNADFMARVANDPSASSYDSTKPRGQYIYAPTATQLQTAFQQIASQVLRISQ